MLTNTLTGDVTSSVRDALTVNDADEYLEEYVICTLDARTVGKENLIFPCQVAFNGENCAEIIVGFLEDNGFEPLYEGDMQENFYLSAIRGIDTSSLEVSEELKPFLLECEVEWENTVTEENTLGEFDFTDTSGWMYTVNGEIPDVGMNNYIPSSGDEIMLVFTLMYGEDIGLMY